MERNNKNKKSYITPLLLSVEPLRDFMEGPDTYSNPAGDGGGAKQAQFDAADTSTDDGYKSLWEE